jgi:hypothetical protein
MMTDAAPSFSQIPDGVKRLLTQSFTARDVAEPLASFDAIAAATTVGEFMEARDFDVVGVRNEGRIAGYVAREGIGQGQCGQFQRPFEGAMVVNDAASLLDVLLQLKDSPFVFVTVLGEVAAIVTRSDMQKPAVRMWLFGILTMAEMRFSELVERHCLGDSWQQYLSEARLQKAQALLEERSRRNQKLTVLDCLQFSDKGQIIARNEAIRKLTIFASRSQAEEAFKRLEKLRNNLAHSQDILANDWETIVQLGEFVAHH